MTKPETMTKETIRRLREQIWWAELQQPAFLYWVHSAKASDPFTEGYIGVSRKATRRMGQHRRNPSIPRGHMMTILLEGTREDCLRAEARYRPTPNIGLNI